MCPIALHPSKQYLAYYPYQGEHHLIFYKSGGVIRKILDKAFKQLDALRSYYTKVTVVLLQLHQYRFTKGSEPLTRLLSRLKSKLEKHYRSKVGYFWVREQQCAESQHYHLAIMLSGHKCQRSKLVDIATKTYWENLHPDNFSFRVRNRIYRIRIDDNGKELRAARMRLSYMAKADGKNRKNSYTNIFGSSQLRTKPRNKDRFK